MIKPDAIKRPPLGVTPYFLWKYHFPFPTHVDLYLREARIKSAIVRYKEAGKMRPIRWYIELISIKIKLL